MSALAEALLAAQRQAVGSLSKAFVAGKIDAEALATNLDGIGLRDDVDQGLLLCSLEVVKALGGEAPKAAGTANGTPKEAKPASEAQWKLIRRLADERGQVAPEGPLTVDEASRVIAALDSRAASREDRNVTDAKPYPKAKQLGRGERRYRRKVASPKRWAAIMDAKRGPCRVCKRDTTHLQAFRAGSVTWHHIVPRDFHGDDLADNIVPLCFACHEKVTALHPQSCLALCASLTDAEHAYAIGKLGEGAFERVYRVVLT